MCIRDRGKSIQVLLCFKHSATLACCIPIWALLLFLYCSVRLSWKPSVPQAVTLLWTCLKQGKHGVPLAKKAVVVAPSSPVGNWRNEIFKVPGGSNSRHSKPLPLSCSHHFLVRHTMLLCRARGASAHLPWVLCIVLPWHHAPTS